MTSGGLIATGVWYHVAFTYDQSAMKLYCNGQPVAAADRPAFDAERSRLTALLHPAPVSPLAQLGD